MNTEIQASTDNRQWTREELLEARIAQRDAELMEWARRYDDAVQPLQRRCLELIREIERLNVVLNES